MAGTGVKSKKEPPKHLKPKKAARAERSSALHTAARPAPKSARYDDMKAARTVKAKMKRRELITGANKIVEDAIARGNAAPDPAGIVEPINDQLIQFAEKSHELNRRRMKNGVIWLFVLPVLLYIVRVMTDSSKIAFLIIWILGMFIISAFLVLVAYTDNDLQENLHKLQQQIPSAEELNWAKLGLPELEQSLSQKDLMIQRAIRAKLAEKTAKEANDAEYMEDNL